MVIGTNVGLKKESGIPFMQNRIINGDTRGKTELHTNKCIYSLAVVDGAQFMGLAEKLTGSASLRLSEHREIMHVAFWWYQVPVKGVDGLLCTVLYIISSLKTITS